MMWRIVEAETFGQYDLSSVTRIGYGGAPAAPELVERIKAAFPQVRSSLSTAYGLTEIGVGRDRDLGRGLLRAARTRSASRCRRSRRWSSTTTATRSRRTTVGELALRGPTIMMRGYWNRPDATAAVFLPDGWFHTGDIARIDDEGFCTSSTAPRT